MLIQLYYNGISIERRFALLYKNGTRFTALYANGSTNVVEIVDGKFYAV